LPRDVLLDGSDNPCTTYRGHCPLKIWEGKSVQNLVRFTTTFDFDRKYLWTGWRYRQAVNGVIKNS